MAELRLNDLGHAREDLDDAIRLAPAKADAYWGRAISRLARIISTTHGVTSREPEV